ncbi:hypothetical protein ABTZ78_17140 [Streptomyces bauhiniae]|uniref:hypothetical protein n=1 Tax=Streptomyces bauhiniae TaxID=2340725 RepID=UPI00331EB668
MLFHTTWAVAVRMETADGHYAEYTDSISVVGNDGHEPTAADLTTYAKDMIVDSVPRMKAGRTVLSNAHRVG